MEETKGMSMPVIIALIVVVLVGGGLLFVMNTPQDSAQLQDEMETMSGDDEEMMDTGDQSSDDGSVTNQEGSTVTEVDDVPRLATGYEPYAPEKLSRAEDGNVVLFFSASWCPTCRALDGDIKENVSNIPEGLTILQVDYDSATELRQKYGVTRQHTMVQVAADGSEIAKWSGSRTLSALIAEVQ